MDIKQKKNFTLNVNEPKKGGSNSNTEKVTITFNDIVKIIKLIYILLLTGKTGVVLINLM